MSIDGISSRRVGVLGIPAGDNVGIPEVWTEVDAPPR